MKFKIPCRFVLIAFAVALAGCGDKQVTALPAPQASPEIVVPVKRDHNYEVKDGLEYGYTTAISENDKKNYGASCL